MHVHYIGLFGNFIIRLTIVIDTIFVHFWVFTEILTKTQ